MREILTLQLGHRANYLATHFWNTQVLRFFSFQYKLPAPLVRMRSSNRSSRNPILLTTTKTPRPLIITSISAQGLAREEKTHFHLGRSSMILKEDLGAYGNGEGVTRVKMTGRMREMPWSGE